MSSAPSAPVNQTPHEPSAFAAFLSYLIPGLGQIYQGRYGKGILFMVSLLGMFYLGQAMGNWQNVYIQHPDDNRHHPDDNRQNPRSLVSLITRWHYGGQFWIGISAWPALFQHFEMPVPGKTLFPILTDYQKMPEEHELNRFFVNSDKTPDLGWVYTVVAGMLNILVMYDAYAGPVFFALPRPASREAPAAKSAAKQEGAA